LNIVIFKIMKFIYALAPIEDMTNDSFRTLAHNHGADVTFSEMVLFESLAKKNKSSLTRIKITNNVPTVIQILGLSEYYLKKFLSQFEPEPGFLGFNLNLGCPAPGVVNYGMGCSMIKRVAKVKKLTEIIKKRGFRVNLKLRLGANAFEKEKKVYINLIKGVSVDYYIIHARHGKESYNTPPDWSVFKECCNLRKKIIANGNIKTKKDVELLKSYGVSGVMIGRAAITNPGIFNELKGNPKVPISQLRKEYLELSKNDPSIRHSKNILKHMRE
jgi:tRNA-dihydrouridine synthase B